MPQEGRERAGYGQGLREGYRFCPNCGTPWPARPVKAGPAPAFTPEEILAKEPPPAPPEASPKEEERVAEARRGWNSRPVHKTAHVPSPKADLPTPPLQPAPACFSVPISRLFTVALLMLLVGLVLAGCANPHTQTDGAGKERGAEKAANDERPSDEKGPGPRKPTSSAPEDVLASQYQHVNAGDYGAAYDLFDGQSQQLVSRKQYGAYFASVAPYEITSYSFPSVRVQRDTASLVVDLAVSSSTGENRYRVTQRMVREDGSWRVVMREEQVASFTGTGSSSANASASAGPSSGGSGGNYDATVTLSRVVDGDTIEISPRIGGNEEVRLIGIDTPETKDSSEGVEPYGPEASAFTTDELTGQSVGLEFDVEREDQYDRLLAYVYVGGEMFNEVLIEEGYAQAYPYEPNTKYEDRFAAAQE